MMAAYRCPVCDYVYDEANGDARKASQPAQAGIKFPTTGAAGLRGAREGRFRKDRRVTK